MNLNKSLYQKSAFYFVLFFVFTVWAFWPTYFGHLLNEIPMHMHIHGILMSIWCLMLIGQAFLIRLKKQKVHKIVGKASYLLILLILISGFNTAQLYLKDGHFETENHYSQLALMFGSLIMFAIFFALAIYYRKKPLVHARYMICTLFPIITPLTDRLIFNNFEGILPIFPTINDSPMVWLAGFLIADIILIALSIIDWKAKKRFTIFPKVLIALGFYHLSVITFYKFQFWQTIGDWLMSLPFS